MVKFFRLLRNLISRRPRIVELEPEPQERPRLTSEIGDQQGEQRVDGHIGNGNPFNPLSERVRRRTPFIPEDLSQPQMHFRMESPTESELNPPPSPWSSQRTLVVRRYTQEQAVDMDDYMRLNFPHLYMPTDAPPAAPPADADADAAPLLCGDVNPSLECSGPPPAEVWGNPPPDTEYHRRMVGRQRPLGNRSLAREPRQPFVPFAHINTLRNILRRHLRVGVPPSPRESRVPSPTDSEVPVYFTTVITVEVTASNDSNQSLLPTMGSSHTLHHTVTLEVNESPLELMSIQSAIIEVLITSALGSLEQSSREAANAEWDMLRRSMRAGIPAPDTVRNSRYESPQQSEPPVNTRGSPDLYSD